MDMSRHGVRAIFACRWEVGIPITATISSGSSHRRLACDHLQVQEKQAQKTRGHTTFWGACKEWLDLQKVGRLPSEELLRPRLTCSPGFWDKSSGTCGLNNSTIHCWGKETDANCRWESQIISFGYKASYFSLNSEAELAKVVSKRSDIPNRCTSAKSSWTNAAFFTFHAHPM